MGKKAAFEIKDGQSKMQKSKSLNSAGVQVCAQMKNT